MKYPGIILGEFYVQVVRLAMVCKEVKARGLSLLTRNRFLRLDEAWSQVCGPQVKTSFEPTLISPCHP